MMLVMILTAIIVGLMVGVLGLWIEVRHWRNRAEFFEAQWNESIRLLRAARDALAASTSQLKKLK